jgi:hypothetical protein
VGAKLSRRWAALFISCDAVAERERQGMVEIVNLAEWRKRTREEFTEEILHHDRNAVPDDETDRLIATLNTLIHDTPMAHEEKLVVVWTKLVELLAAIDDEAQRKLYVNRITTLLNKDIVEAARAAFSQFPKQ